MTEANTEKSFQVIIRGRMPIAAVALAKSKAVEGTTDSTVANMFNTTTGKIHDIRTGRCFGYIDGDFKPTEEQVAEAVSWLGRHKDGAEAVADLVAELQGMDRATAADVEAFTAKRGAVRKTAEPKLDEEGNPIPKAPRKARTPKAPKEPKAQVADTGADDSDVDDLLN